MGHKRGAAPSFYRLPARVDSDGCHLAAVLDRQDIDITTALLTELRLQDFALYSPRHGAERRRLAAGHDLLGLALRQASGLRRHNGGENQDEKGNNLFHFGDSGSAHEVLAKV